MTKSVPYIELAGEIIHRALAQHAPHDRCPECRIAVCPRCERIHRVTDNHTCPTRKEAI